ncbi:KPN_02809 family neutral zinc metallopeptidase [Actinomarinicola tropica]|uniref:Neutral zinc metallopeptidase n=1 Tax=Actinomarinicola tropica TaxID=2789776 RepID=A0A5Q2RPT8_9ACTN|nr:neutral zinc metallopeptidase [Actinomarinicola tropica]QGG96456.1 hypothetical protein GH723_15855 [Actinomarinicola tropica]
MRFRKNARLDASQVQDRRGMRAGGAAAIGGGGIGGLILLALLLFGGGGGGGGGGLAQALESLDGLQVQQGEPNDLSDECRTGADANERDDCRIVAVVNSVQAYWQDGLDGYQQATTVFFTDAVSTRCGNATSAVGPFYCPADQTIYIDLGFYDELRNRFGAQGGPLAEAYVIAHEYGHHISNLTGDLERSRDGETGPTSGSVRAELQADCYAGAWAANASGPDGIIEPLTQADIADALDAASVIGDDRIQEMSQGRVTPESWTHGSAEQRQRWFQRGYDSGDPSTCDTFSIAGSEL